MSKKFEYNTLAIRSFNGVIIESYHECLDTLGQKGWEAFAFEGNHIHLKREIIEERANLVTGIIEPQPPLKVEVEQQFDYSYFLNNDHIWIKAGKHNIMTFICICTNNNVWFNYYPNTNNSDYPWLIVKSGMKEKLIRQAEAYNMFAEFIPGEHMTEDKL